MKKMFFYIVLIVLTAFPVIVNSAPDNFRSAKKMARQDVYYDRTESGDFYCGCKWRWVGESGSRTDLKSCGYKVRAQATRAQRGEWEHIMPAYEFGNQRQCWKKGGRKFCNQDDPVFNVMESNLFNLTLALGEINADRSNFRYSELAGEARQYGSCDAETDFKGRKFEPRPEVRGQIARTYFYMHDRYNLRMSSSQERLFIAWNNLHPVSAWEKERERRIAKLMGHHNEFVTGDRAWIKGHKNSGDGLVSSLSRNVSTKSAPKGNNSYTKVSSTHLLVRGNRNSGVYHLSVGCPSFNRISERNRIEFSSEQEAKKAGFQIAGNCR